MTAKILDSFGGKFAEKWVATLVTPAFVFWLGGFAIIVQKGGWPTFLKEFMGYSEFIRIVALVVLLCIIAASAFIVQRFDLATLRFLEGYWYPPIRQPFIRCYQNRRKKLNDESQKLRAIETERIKEQQDLKSAIDNYGSATLTSQQKERYLELDESILTPIEQIKLGQAIQSLSEMPTAAADLMPTQLGNLLRAAERKPLDKYGLDAIICWSRLWMLLPELVRKDLQEARTDLNTAARIWLWSILFCSWSFFGMGWSYWANRSQIFSCGWSLLSEILLATWALWLGLLSAWFAYKWAIDAARTYGALIEASFDIYRHLLYESQRWHLPPDLGEERRTGRKLTQYLTRGFFVEE